MNNFALDTLLQLVICLDKRKEPVYKYPADEKDKKLEMCVVNFWKRLQWEINHCSDTKQIKECLDYAYCKVYAYYKAKVIWYYDAYLMERLANEKFMKITVGVYKVVEEFMKELGRLYDGRI